MPVTERRDHRILSVIGSTAWSRQLIFGRLPKFPPLFLRSPRKRLIENLERVFYFGYRLTASGTVAGIQAVVVFNGSSAVVGLVD
jgi:hypothetical protein